MSYSEHYQIGVSGDIEATVYATEFDAMRAAKARWEGLSEGQHIAVYGFREYSADDKTPSYGRTEFWRNGGIDYLGRVDEDGTGRFRW